MTELKEIKAEAEKKINPFIFSPEEPLTTISKQAELIIRLCKTIEVAEDAIHGEFCGETCHPIHLDLEKILRGEM